MERQQRYSKSKSKKIIIIGGGPAGIACAYFLKIKKPHWELVILEKNKTLGRKILIAGDGGLNLTHNETKSEFVKKYHPEQIQKIVECFGNVELMQWLSEIGLKLFIGSSDRVFPSQEFKPIDVLNLLSAQLKSLGVDIQLKQEVKQIKQGAVVMESGVEMSADYIVVASGSPAWVKDFKQPQWSVKIKKIPFESNNAKLFVSNHHVIEGQEGKVLKHVELKYLNESFVGDINIGLKSMESTPIYALCNAYRSKALGTEFFLDLLPHKKEEDLYGVLSKSSSRNQFFDKIKLGKVKKNIVKQYLSKEEFLSDKLLIQTLKNMSFQIKSFDEVENAISAAGGIALNEVNDDLELKKMRNVFVAGELLDWNAPTGGYLLTMCFSMGKWVADHLSDLE